MYNISVFADLVTKYPTWDELKAYLTSEAGGSIRIVGEGDRVILRYDKKQSRMEDPVVGWMRSVVWDTRANRPICVAPPKAQRGDIPTGDGVSSQQVQDFLDGTMINVYRCVGEDTVSVCTRTQLGALGTFYSQKTFATLFEEALVASGHTMESLKAALDDPSPEHPAIFASFLLQHPEHRVVSRCLVSRLWLIHTGSVDASGLVTLQEDTKEFPPACKGMAVLAHPVTGFRTEKDLSNYFGSLAAGRGWFWQGLVAKDGHGRRWRMRNPNYLYLRGLRGGEAKAEDRFLRLRNESKVTEYLRHYSEDRDLFWDLETRLRERTQDVFAAYAEVHKGRTKKLADLEKALQPFVYRLHAHYLEHLRPEGKTITKKEVVDLVNNAALFEQRRLLETV